MAICAYRGYGHLAMFGGSLDMDWVMNGCRVLEVVLIQVPTSTTHSYLPRMCYGASPTTY